MCVCLGMCVCVTHLFSPGLRGNWSLSGLIGFFKERQLTVRLLRAPCENRLPVLRHRQTPRIVRKKFQRHLQLFLQRFAQVETWEGQRRGRRSALNLFIWNLNSETERATFGNRRGLKEGSCRPRARSASPLPDPLLATPTTVERIDMNN